MSVASINKLFATRLSAGCLASFRTLFFTCLAYSLYKYKRGYLLFFESFVLPEGLSFGVASLGDFEGLIYINIILFCLAAFGLGGRLLHIGLFCSFTLMEYNIAPYLETYTTYLIPYVLFLFCIYSPWSLMVKEYKRGLLELIFFILCLSYLSAGLTKLLINPLGWLNGEHLAKHFIFNYLYTNQSLLLSMSQSKILLSIMGFSTLIFELFFILSFYKRRWIPFFVLAGLFFHGGIYFFFHINFFHFYVPLYFAPIALFVEKWKQEKAKIV